MKPITEQTPCEIDTELAKLYSKKSDLCLRLYNVNTTLERLRREQSAQPRHHYVSYIEECERDAKKFKRQIDELCRQMEPGQEEFRRRGGWKRYYLVHGGHVHREMTCSTCFPRTQFGWLPNLSDCDESVMVKEHGDGACAVCFPEVQSHPDFLAARARRLATEAAEASKLCPKSGTYARGDGFRRYVKCECGRGVNVSNRGKIRKHMKPEPKS